MTDGAGAVVERYGYGDYGEPTVMDAAGTPIAESAIGNPYLFHGRRYDPETGLYYYRTRYLDPRVGRFLSRDTIGQYGDPANLGNGQAFVGNNPWSRLDPTGQYSWEELYYEHLSPDALKFKAGVVGHTFAGAGKALYGFGEATYVMVGGAIHAYTDAQSYAGFEEPYNQLGEGLYSLGTHPIETTSQGIRNFQDQVTEGLLENDSRAVGEPIGKAAVTGLIISETLVSPAARALVKAPGYAGRAGTTLTTSVYELSPATLRLGLHAFDKVTVRLWYLARIESIPARLNKFSSLESQARQAFSLRNAFRRQTRDLGPDTPKHRSFYAENPNKTFNDLVKLYSDRGFTGDALYREIIAASQRTNPAVNEALGIVQKR